MPPGPDLPHPPPADAGQISPAALAYVGDAVYTLLVRSLLVGRGPARQSELHVRSVAAVRAPAQARALDKLEAHLTGEERTIVRRARNAHVGRGGGGTGAERHFATGLEALFGYLYLSGRIERLLALFDVIASPAGGFPGGDDGDRRAPEIKLNLAQMYFQEKNFDRSIQITTEILKKYKKSPQSKDGADLMLAAAQTNFESERPRLKLPAPGRAKNPIPLTKISSQYADSLDLYLESFPKSPNADAIIFAAASVYFDFGDYDEAGVRFDRLVSEHPNSDFGIKAAYSMLGYYLLIKDEELLTEFQQLCAKSAKIASHPEIAPLLKRKISSSTAAKPEAKNSPTPSASPAPEVEEDESEESAE